MKMIIRVPNGEMFEATVANGLVTVLNAAGGIYQVLFPNNMGRGRLVAELQLSNTVSEVIVSRKFSIVGDGSLTSDGAISVLPGAGILYPIIIAEPARVAAEIIRVANNAQAQEDEAARIAAEAARAGFYGGFNSQLAAIDTRVDNLVTTPVPVGEIIAEEIIDARQGELSVGANITAVKNGLAQNLTSKKPLILSRLPRFAFGNYRYNSQSFTQDSLTTFNGYQYVVWYDYRKVPFIGKRKLPEGKWETFELGLIAGEPLRYQAIDDGHNVLAVAIDGDGYIHISGNMHNATLRYIRSANPENINSWETIGMTGVDEDSVTYPCFVRRNDGNLLFFYRDGISGLGNTQINIYDTVTRLWTKPTSVLLDGVVSSESPYLNHVSVGNDGSIQVSGSWRSAGGQTTNDIFYLKSLDGGVTWRKSTGVQYTLPITHATIETILDTTPTGAGLLNQNGFDVDDDNLPHLAYFKYDANGYSNIFHLYHDGVSWIEKQVTTFTKINSMLETDNQYMNLSRPSIAAVNNKVYIIYRMNYGELKGTVRMTEATPSLTQYPDFPILNLDTYDWEPTFDTVALKERKELHMIVTPATEANAIVDNWKEQYIGALSIDLNQMERIIRDEVKIPGLKLVKSITGGETTFAAVAAGVTTLPYGQFAMDEDESKIFFARLSVRGKSDLYTLLTIQIKLVSNLGGTSDTYIFNSAIIDAKTTTVNRKSHYAPFNIVGGQGLIVLQKDIAFTTTGVTGNGTINGVNVEIFELA